MSIGYADGVSRSLSGKISGIVGGALVPQVGAIAMDQMVFDITELKGQIRITLLLIDELKRFSEQILSCKTSLVGEIFEKKEQSKSGKVKTSTSESNNLIFFLS